MDKKQLIEKRKALMALLNKITGKAQDEKRSLTADEVKDFDKHRADIAELDTEIRRASEAEALNTRQSELETELRSPVSGPSAIPLDDAKAGKGSALFGLDEKRSAEIQSKYSFARVIRAAVQGKSINDGIEAELMQEELRNGGIAGVSYRGVFIPAAVFALSLRAAASAGGAGTGAEFVGTFHEPAIIQSTLNPAYILPRLGVTMLNGLTSNVEFVRETNSTAAAFVAETGSSTEIALATEKFTLSPKRIPVYTDMTLQLLLQSGPSIEAYVRGMLLGKVLARFQSGVLAGTGSSNQPTGIINQSGIGAVAIGTNGGAPTLAHLIDLETELDTDESLMGQIYTLTNGKVRGKLKKTAVESGQTERVWGKDNLLNGYDALVSNSIPSNLTKGTASGVCSAILSGDFSKAIAATFGGIDVLPDPYTQRGSGSIRVYTDMFGDANVVRPQAFAAIKDATTT